MPFVVDPRHTGAAIVGNVNQALLEEPPREPERKPSLLDTLAAAATVNPVGGLYDRLSTPSAADVDAPPDYDALEDIAGYEDLADNFLTAETPTEVAAIKYRIDRRRADRETLQRAGFGGTAAEIFFGLVDPTFVASVGVPEIALARAARLRQVLTAAARGGASATAYEGVLQGLDETRSLEQSAFNVGAGALLGGVLGSLGRRVPKAELDQVRAAVRDEMLINPNPGEQSFGAAAARAATTLEEQGFAAGGETLAKAAGKIPFAKTDTQRVMLSESLEARRALQELVEIPAATRDNLRGIASPVSVETLIEREMGRPADFVHEMRSQFKAYKARKLAPGEIRLSRDAFERSVAFASRRTDSHAIPEVAAAARSLRERVFDPLKREAQKLKLLPPDGEISLFAESYFKRMYDRHAIRAGRDEWDELLTTHFAGKGLDRAEARAVAEDVTRRILGTDVGLANFHIRPHIPNAGPLEARVLDIDDELVEKFLVNDPVKVATAYVREMAPQIHIAKRYGDKDARDIFQRVADDYMTKRGLARGDVKRLGELQDQEREILDTLSRLVLRLYGRAGALAPEASIGERVATMVLRGWRNLVASAKLGSTAITGGVQDLSKIVGMYGFGRTMSKLTKLVTNPVFRKLSKSNARRLGVATEVALARRVAVASDGAITEGWTEKLANLTFRASGLNHVTDMWRTLAATLIEDKILRASADVAAGKALPKGLRTDLAQIGLDEGSLRRIAEQATKHGDVANDVRTSGSMYWTDSHLADLYDAAIIKEARVAVMQPGVGDRVWWADGELGKTIGQLKAFSLSAPLRMTMAPVQLLGQKRFAAAARLTGALMVGGYLSHVFRQLAAGKEFATDPQAVAGEAFTESGLGGILPDIVSPFARRFGFMGESARFSDRNVGSAFGGPAVGTLFDTYDVAMNRSTDGISAKDLQAIRRLLPLQNLWWLRRSINALEGETAEALDLAGADAQSFGARVIETKPLLSTDKRGGTGTGAVVQ